jgi:hypothetical protein
VGRAVVWLVITSELVRHGLVMIACGVVSDSSHKMLSISPVLSEFHNGYKVITERMAQSKGIKNGGRAAKLLICFSYLVHLQT